MKGMNRITTVVLGVVLAILLAGASFYGGMLYGKGQSTGAQTTGRLNGQNPYFGQPGQSGTTGQARGGGLFGQVVQAGEGVLIIADNNGAQTKIQVTDTTLIEKNASVKLTDIAQGETVMVSGTQGSDGTWTARSIQVAPAGRFGGPAGDQNPAGQNAPGINSGNQNRGNNLPPPPGQ